MYKHVYEPTEGGKCLSMYANQQKLIHKYDGYRRRFVTPERPTRSFECAFQHWETVVFD